MGAFGSRGTSPAITCSEEADGWEPIEEVVGAYGYNPSICPPRAKSNDLTSAFAFTSPKHSGLAALLGQALGSRKWHPVLREAEPRR